jgi:CubicO group peptidase (beta-lactamase class C family)
MVLMPEHLTRDGLAQFSEVAARQVGDDKVPGLVALVARGDRVDIEALGSLSVGGPPVQRDSLFRIASTTKPITGAATGAS